MFNIIIQTDVSYLFIIYIYIYIYMCVCVCVCVCERERERERESEREFLHVFTYIDWNRISVIWDNNVVHN